MKDSKLQKLFLKHLRAFYGAEIEIAEFFPKLREAANSEMLKEVLSDHIQMIQRQIGLLEKVFENYEELPNGHAGPAVKGLIKEGANVLAEPAPGVTDAALILAAQKIHYFEMASYGSLVTLASELGDPQTAALLQAAEPHSVVSASD